MVSAFGKSLRVVPVPCQFSVQPPACLPTSLAPSPATSCFGDSGSTPPWFFSSTSDSRTACRATARCAGAPISANWPPTARADGLPASNRPSRILTRRIRRTASSRRRCEMVPFFAAASVVV
ncbi:hypothetical protein [Pantoea ananatis]|uniref:hypothetical protein n=1 Tax=Pantoea ananas TaxID=553 RepID=UPI0039B8D8DE